MTNSLLSKLVLELPRNSLIRTEINSTVVVVNCRTECWWYLITLLYIQYSKYECLLAMKVLLIACVQSIYTRCIGQPYIASEWSPVFPVGCILFFRSCTQRPIFVPRECYILLTCNVGGYEASIYFKFFWLPLPGKGFAFGARLPLVYVQCISLDLKIGFRTTGIGTTSLYMY